MLFPPPIPSPQVRQIIKALNGAYRYDGSGDPAWGFWNFSMSFDGSKYTFFEPHLAHGIYAIKTGPSGIVDEMRRRFVRVPFTTVARYCDQKGQVYRFEWCFEWRIAVQVDLNNGWTSNCRCLVWCPMVGKSPNAEAVSGLDAVWIDRAVDPEGSQIALGCMYSKQLMPLIDWLLESDLYADHHEAIRHMWEVSAPEITA